MDGSRESRRMWKKTVIKAIKEEEGSIGKW